MILLMPNSTLHFCGVDGSLRRSFSPTHALPLHDTLDYYSLCAVSSTKLEERDAVRRI